MKVATFLASVVQARPLASVPHVSHLRTVDLHADSEKTWEQIGDLLDGYGYIPNATCGSSLRASSDASYAGSSRILVWVESITRDHADTWTRGIIVNI